MQRDQRRCPPDYEYPQRNRKRILDPKIFFDVMESGRSVQDKRVYLAEYQKYIEESVIYDKSYRIIMCVMRDVTAEESEREKERRNQPQNH